MNPLKAANPVSLTHRAAGVAGTAVGLAGPLARAAAHAPVGIARGAFRLAGAATGRPATVAGDVQTSRPDIPADAPETVAEVAGTPDDGRGAVPPGPSVVPVEPHAPQEPPVDVVGEALAAEAAAERGEAPDGAGLAHEPRGASRDDEHGDAGPQRAEVDEVAAEAEAALTGDVEPEEHLTDPLVDPADVKAVAAEQRTMSRAADPDKG